MRAVAVFFALSTLLASGCAFTDGNDSSQAAASIRIDGSSTVYPITEAVAEEFHAMFPSVRVTIGVSGTGGGFKKFWNGEIDIANASRPILPAEVDACAVNSVGFYELPVAYDGIVVVVHPKNTWVDRLTVRELKTIWESAAQGKILYWDQVRPTFPHVKLQLFGPGTDSGTFDYFTEAVVGKKGDSRGDYTASEDDNILVQGVLSDVGALGYFGIAYYQENRARLKIVPIDDEDDRNGRGAVFPTEQTVHNGSYAPLARALFIYVREQSLEREQVRQFVDFYLSHAEDLAREVGYLPLPAEVYQLVAQRLARGVTGTMYPDGREVGTDLRALLAEGFNR